MSLILESTLEWSLKDAGCLIKVVFYITVEVGPGPSLQFQIPWKSERAWEGMFDMNFIAYPLSLSNGSLQPLPSMYVLELGLILSHLRERFWIVRVMMHQFISATKPY